MLLATWIALGSIYIMASLTSISRAQVLLTKYHTTHSILVDLSHMLANTLVSTPTQPQANQRPTPHIHHPATCAKAPPRSNPTGLTSANPRSAPNQPTSSFEFLFQATRGKSSQPVSRAVGVLRSSLLELWTCGSDWNCGDGDVDTGKRPIPRSRVE